MRVHRSTLPRLLLLVLVLLSAPLRATAQEQQAEAPTAVRVATRAVPPFAYQGQDGVWRGLAIEVWNQAAERLNLETTWVETGLAEMLAEVEAGTVDAAAGALTVTADRERVMDFSHPFLSSGIGIAVRLESDSGLLGVLRQLVSLEFLGVLLALGGLLLACGVLVWLFERRANAEEFGEGLGGIGSGFWWSAVTMTTVGYGDKAPKTLGGRVVGLVWMFASIIVISGFTAAIASSLTVGRLSARIQGADDLPGARVGTVGESTSEAWTRSRGLRAETFAGAEAALAALAAGDLDAVVYDAPVLRHVVQRDQAGRLHVLPDRVERQGYAIAMPQESPLREELNRVVLELTSSEDWSVMLERTLGR